jgi:hypothetical protein
MVPFAEDVRAKDARQIPNNRANLLRILDRVLKQTDFFVPCHKYANRPTELINALWLSLKTVQPGKCFKRRAKFFSAAL